MQDLPYSLMTELEKVARKDLPPVALWQPEVEKDIDMEVLPDGTWNYMGTPILRRRLIHLFASVLRKEGDDYYLVTPLEKCRIRVLDVPFQIILMNVIGEGASQSLEITTDMGETVVVDSEHPLRMVHRNDESIPYVMIRAGMEGRMNRNVYYQLAGLLTDREGELGVWSRNHFFEVEG
ncbi:MAG: proteophosphoglycan precursor [Gammaproteobacteria bacterium]|nr:proteophosphoglycan precursor [Gammaproteobacteria bacterium]